MADFMTVKIWKYAGSRTEQDTINRDMDSAEGGEMGEVKDVEPQGVHLNHRQPLR